MGSPVKRGAFIVFEGCDRSGKSTQSRLLVKFLQSQSIPVKYMAFPERTSIIGKVIHAYLTNKQQLNDETIHLLFTANRWEYENEIMNIINSGTTLVVDRYSYSGLAYSAAKGMTSKWCMTPESGLPRPDIVFYMKTTVDTLLHRGNFGKERYEKKDFQTKVADTLEEIYKKEKHYWHEIDAKQSKDDIHFKIKERSLELLKFVEDSQLKKLEW